MCFYTVCTTCIVLFTIMLPIWQTRTAVSINIKKEICEYMLANPNVKQAAVASFFNEKNNKKK